MPASTTAGDGDALPRGAQSPVGVLIVADTRLHRDGLAETLRSEHAVRVLESAADHEDALARAGSVMPAVILVDMEMRDAMQTVRALAQETPEARILALAVPEAEEYVIACVEAGASGCVMRDAPLAEAVSAVKAVARGEAPCSPLMTAAVFERVRKLAAARPHALEGRLTPREREILSLMDEGLSNKQIAQRLCIETATVKNHVHSILDKLRVTRRGEAVAAMRHGGDATHDLEPSLH